MLFQSEILATPRFNSSRHVRKEVLEVKLTKQLLSKIVIGIIILAVVAGFAVAYAGPSIASAQTATPTPSATQQKDGAKKGNFKNFDKFKGHEFGPASKAVLDAASKALTITTAELKTQLKAGKSVADVAADKKIDLQTVKDSILAAIKSELDTRVKDGKITQAQADTRYEAATSTIDKVVNAKFTGRTHHTRAGKK
jgi:hypothetical protein